MIYLAWFTMGLAFILFLVSFINVLANQYLPDYAISHKPLVSILIPARNEEDNIGSILSDLDQLSYRNLEILVYNDESTDQTEDIIFQYMRKDRRIRLVPYVTLPKSWTGKNHACHRLAREARGEYFLFLDADVRIKGSVVENAIYWLNRYHLALISVFPVQMMKTVAEKISVPLMNWILLSMLPMPLIRLSNRPSLAAANGQFMLFPAKVYKHYLPHEVFKNHRVEDVAIIRFLKKEGYRVDTFLGKQNVSCRMYRRLGEAIEGFTKNIFLFFGNSIILTVLYALLITLGPLLVVLYLPQIYWFVLAALIIIMRLNISLASRQPVFVNLLFLIPQHVVFLLIIGKAIVNRFSGKLEWKGRNILNTSL